MKIILSRKGFDSSVKSGGVASPILPDGTLLSLPIPTDSSSKIRYKDVNGQGESLSKIVEDLTNHRVSRYDYVHLDPDLRGSAYPRLPKWRPLFGQASAAQTHLKNNGVSVGDLFLFFGWFREVELINGKYRFIKGAPDLHVFYGWLQIGAVISVEENLPYVPQWAEYHHHFRPPTSPTNTVYVSRSKFTLDERIKGAGAFKKFKEELCLTCSNQLKRSVWKLALWFYPDSGLPPLSYHPNKSKWTRKNGYTILESVGRGQEFVLDANKYPKAKSWARNLIRLGLT